MKRKLIALLLVLCMLLAAAPVLAETEQRVVTKLYVDGVDALVTPQGEGWSYNAQTGVLTLNNCDLNGLHVYVDSLRESVTAIIFAEGDLVIEVVGENSVEAELTDMPSSTMVGAIVINNDYYPAKFTGSGTLTAGISVDPSLSESLWYNYVYGFSAQTSDMELDGLTDGGTLDFYAGIPGTYRYDCGRAIQNGLMNVPSHVCALSYHDIAGAFLQDWYNANENNCWRLVLTTERVAKPEAETMYDVPVLPEDSGFFAEDTVELQELMVEKLKADLGIPEFEWDGTELLDVRAKVWNPVNGDWDDATEADFDELGNKLQITYPISWLSGATEDCAFFALHVFEHSWNGQTAGDYEIPEVSVVGENLVFELNGCSPVLIAWSEDAPIIPEHTHSGGTATCTEQAICEGCGEPYGDFAAHALTKSEEKAATCSDTGVAEHWYCECGALFADEDAEETVTENELILPIDSDNHVGDTEVRGAKAATETEKGYTGDTYCTSCDNLLEEGEDIPKKESERVPDTGDIDTTVFWITLMMLALIGIALCTKKRKA